MEAIARDISVVPIASLVDVETSRRLAESCARELEFDAVSIAELQLITSELATNVLVHGLGGTMRIGTTGSPGAGIRIVAEDAGPGIPDVPLAMTPRYSSTGSIGEGLSIVKRLSDTFDIRTSPAGTIITVTKRARA